ncbi:TetR/AcrR family transcriptional regulator [Henriciella litoralis]|uniref:TetR/AcrR family transcriptional regulator n=1 Tax=Henriciella litoralis TaxID=568102 RepID=UPI00146DBCBB|nr:TetR/AcrR family transcriptional regulator [Henriciella litoralis]
MSASQQLLSERGLESFTSNLIVERAGLTPPTFYRWFEHKHSVLEILFNRLMEMQDEVVKSRPLVVFDNLEEVASHSAVTLSGVIDVTQEFIGSHALMVSVRAIPELAPLRRKAHNTAAKIIFDNLVDLGHPAKKAHLLARTQLVVEFSYSTIEMLFETAFKNRRLIVDSAGLALASIIQID